MKDIVTFDPHPLRLRFVTFETALRLRDAGFPQPKFSIRQTWYAYLCPEIYPDGTEFYIANAGAENATRFIAVTEDGFATTGEQEGNRQGELYNCSVLFAPTATDILREMADYELLSAATSDTQQFIETITDPEALAEAWLRLNAKQ